MSKQSRPLKISAIVLNWKRPDNVKKIIHYLQARDYIDEIIVWNNSPGPFAYSVTSDKVRVVNSKQNLKDHGKYLACSQAKNAHCFYQDDDWHTAHYLDLLYRTFCLNPGHIHTTTNAANLAENLFWTYYNQPGGIHAEFSWIGCGAMFSKDIATRFLKLIETCFDQTMRDLADRAFTCLENQPVVQIEVPLVPLNQDHALSSVDNFVENKKKVIDQIHYQLPNIENQLVPLPEYRIRAINQNLALFSTVRPLDYLYASIVYENQAEFESRDIKKLKNRSFNEFLDSSYTRALGPDPDRNWKAQFNHHDCWGIFSESPINLQVAITANDTTTGDSRWIVNTDGTDTVATGSEINKRNFHFKQMLNFTYADAGSRYFRIKVFPASVI